MKRFFCVLAMALLIPACSKDTAPTPTIPAQVAFGKTGLQTATPPSIQFTNVTKEAGIDFVHYHGGYGQKLLPETTGSGVLIFDFNQDGHQDILYVNSMPWPHYKYPQPPPAARMALYLNDGTGHFRNITNDAGLGNIEFYGMGAVAGDIDNDGFPDVLITGLNRCYLLHNEAGKRLRDITEEAGLNCPGWSSSAAFLDYDRDGKLDLFVGHYVKWTPETDLFCSLVGNEKGYCQPMLYEGQHCQLFHNEGGLKFKDVSEKAGIQILDVLKKRSVSKCLGVAIHDFNDDGWPDIAVANDTTPNFLFKNNGDGTFTNVAAEKGVELLNDPPKSTARGAMGIHWGYYRDGDTLGLAIANFANEPSGLLRYRKRQDTFQDAAIAEGIAGPSQLPLKFGLFFFDYDNDGRLDLFTTNGHIEPEIERTQATQKYAQPPQLFWNAGATQHGCYREVEEKHAGADLFQPRVGRGAAFGDFDNDGDVDIALNNNNSPAALLRNDCPDTQKSIRLRFRGVKANRDGFGCRAKIWVNGKLQQAELASGGSYMSQSEAVLTFGLDKADKADKLEIRWPAKELHTTEFKDLPAGFTYVIDEDKGIVDRVPFKKVTTAGK